MLDFELYSLENAVYDKPEAVKQMWLNAEADFSFNHDDISFNGKVDLFGLFKKLPMVAHSNFSRGYGYDLCKGLVFASAFAFTMPDRYTAHFLIKDVDGDWCEVFLQYKEFYDGCLEPSPNSNFDIKMKEFMPTYYYIQNYLSRVCENVRGIENRIKAREFLEKRRLEETKMQEQRAKIEATLDKFR